MCPPHPTPLAQGLTSTNNIFVWIKKTQHIIQSECKVSVCACVKREVDGWEAEQKEEVQREGGRDLRRRRRPWFAGKACVGPRPRRGGSPPAGCTGSHLSHTSSPCQSLAHIAMQWKLCRFTQFSSVVLLFTMCWRVKQVLWVGFPLLKD